MLKQTKSVELNMVKKSKKVQKKSKYDGVKLWKSQKKVLNQNIFQKIGEKSAKC